MSKKDPYDRQFKRDRVKKLAKAKQLVDDMEKTWAIEPKMCGVLTDDIRFLTEQPGAKKRKIAMQSALHIKVLQKMADLRDEGYRGGLPARLINPCVSNFLTAYQNTGSEVFDLTEVYNKARGDLHKHVALFALNGKPTEEQTFDLDKHYKAVAEDRQRRDVERQALSIEIKKPRGERKGKIASDKLVAEFMALGYVPNPVTADYRNQLTKNLEYAEDRIVPIDDSIVKRYGLPLINLVENEIKKRPRVVRELVKSGLIKKDEEE